MKKTIILSSIFFGIISCAGKDKTHSNLSSEIKTISDWFSAWELVSDEIYDLHTFESVEFVFYDSKQVISTSAVTIPEGTRIEGPSLFQENLSWKKSEHNGKITLPTGEEVPLGLMVFASPLEESEQQSFFIMPLLDFWKEAGVKSEMPYDLFLTGIFLHEFSHSQQMNGIGSKITTLSENTVFKETLNDEMVEQLFSKDSSYVNMYKLEHQKVFMAIKEPSLNARLKITEEILHMMAQREQQFFISEHEALIDINNLFLTMEGVGQFTMYQWLIHPKGGNLSEEIAFKGTRTKSWVQDEGFGLALLLSNFENPRVWGNEFFGQNSNTLTHMLIKVVEES